MQKQFQLSGSIVAIVTPFLENLDIDYRALDKLIEFQVESGTSGIVVCGTTGEAATLTEDEYHSVIDFTVNRVAGRIPVIAGVGSNSTAQTLRNIEIAESCGVDALLVVSPYYNKPNRSGMIQHFETVARYTPLPVILYNVPGRTGVNMSADLVLQLAESNQNIVAIKEASGDLGQIMTILANRPDNFKVFSGDDALAFAVVALGGEGCISVVANQIPAQFAEMHRHIAEGDLPQARLIHERYLALMNLNFIESNPVPVKACLAMMGLINHFVRTPLGQLDAQHASRLRAELEALQLLSDISYQPAVGS